MSVKTFLVTVGSLLVVAVLLISEIPGCSSNPASATDPNTVTMAGTRFSPSSLTVTKGTTVTWMNNDGNTIHTATADDNSWNTGDIAGNSSKSITFNTVGTFPYNCIYHAAMGMTGTIVVK